MCNKITARGKFAGRQLTDIPVLNPGDGFGRTWLLEIGGSYWPLFLVAEGESLTDAIDALADDEKHGHHILVPEEDLGDYDPETCHYSDTGVVIDLDHLSIHGDENSERPFPCIYFGDCLPECGIDPLDYQYWDEVCDTR